MDASAFILGALKGAGVDFALSLPCDRMKTLLSAIDASFKEKHIKLVREEEALGITAGLFLGGKKYAVFVQSSGIGNMVGALLTLTKTYKIPLPLFISHRGIYKEKIYPQIVMGKALEQILNAVGIQTVKVYEKEHLELIPAAIKAAFDKRLQIAILLSPKLFEDEEFNQETFEGRGRLLKLSLEKNYTEPDIRRFEAIKELLITLKTHHMEDDTVIFANIGAPSKEVYYLKNLLGVKTPTFYMLGSLGLVSSIALGYSLCQQRSIISIDGDGSLLMNAGGLSTCAAYGKNNLHIVCIDNGTWGSTGDQPTHAFFTADLEVVARGMGFDRTYFASNSYDLKGILKAVTQREKNFLHVVVKPGSEKVPNVPLSPEEIVGQIRAVGDKPVSGREI